jgi:hypothetical protein
LGGRLCTAEEINTDCTRGSGCSHDGDLMWTSDSEATVPGSWDDFSYTTNTVGGSYVAEISWTLADADGNEVDSSPLGDEGTENRGCPTCALPDAQSTTPFQCEGGLVANSANADATQPSADTCCVDCPGSLWVVELADSWGDGWSGGTFQLSDCDGVSMLGDEPDSSLTVEGSAFSTLLCLDSVLSYNIEVGGGTWGNEISWTVTDVTDPEAPTVVTSGAGTGTGTMAPVVHRFGCPTCGDTDPATEGPQAFSCGGDRPRFLSATTSTESPDAGVCCGPACPHAQDWDLQFIDRDTTAGFDVSVSLRDCDGNSVLGDAQQSSFTSSAAIVHDLCIPSGFRMEVTHNDEAVPAEWRMFDPAGDETLMGGVGQYSTCATCADSVEGTVVDGAIVRAGDVSGSDGFWAWTCDAERPIPNDTFNAAAVPSNAACCLPPTCADLDGSAQAYDCGNFESRFVGSASCAAAVEVTITSATYASEIAWSINDLSGPVYSGGNGAGVHNNRDLVQSVDLRHELTGEHTFVFSDSYGDGWHGGYWTLKDGCGNLLGGGPSDGLVTEAGGQFPFTMTPYETAPSQGICCADGAGTHDLLCLPAYTGESCASCIGDITGTGSYATGKSSSGGAVAYGGGGDGAVNVEDILGILANFQQEDCGNIADLTGPAGVPDCVVSIDDVLTVLGNFRCVA